MDNEDTRDPFAVSRRTVVTAAAVAVPAVLMTVSTPAFAATGAVDTVSVVLGQTTVAPGNSTSVTTTVKDSNGTGLAGQLVTLTTSDSSVTLAAATGTTDTSGVYATTATVANGTANKTVTITATSSSINGTAALAVQTPGVVTGRTTYQGIPAGSVLSADGSKLYIAGRSGSSSSLTRNVTVVDPSTFAVLKTISLQSQFSDNPSVIRRSPDGTRLAVISASNWAIINTSTDTVVKAVSPAQSNLTDVAIDADNRYLYISATGGIYRYDTASASNAVSQRASATNALRVLLNADGTRLFWIERPFVGDPNFRVLDLASGTSLLSQQIADDPANSVSLTLSPDGSKVHVATLLNTTRMVRTFDAATLAVVSDVTVPAMMRDIVATPDGARLVLVDGSGNTTVVDLAAGAASSLAATPVAGTTSFPSLSIAPNGQRVYVSIVASSNVTVNSRVFGVTT